MIYNFVNEFIGYLPPHLEIIKDLMTLFLIMLIPICLVFPIYVLVGKRKGRGL